MTLALTLAIVAGAANFIGGFLSVVRETSRDVLNKFVSISTGFILAVTFLDLYPEVIGNLKEGPLLILAGFVAMFILGNLFAVHAHDGREEHEHRIMGLEVKEEELERHSVWAAWIGFLIHTFFDGAAIAARMMISPVGGALVFLAVLSHKIPEGFSMSSIFQSARFSRTKSFLSAASLGFSTVFGALMVFVVGHQEFSMIFLALATGSFTFIVASELIPHISGTKSRSGILYFLSGIILFYLTSVFLGHFISH